MLRLIAALSRSLPLAIALAVIAVAAYIIISWRRSPARAKEILIKVFLVVCSAISIASALVCLYSVLDKNVPVLELAASCALVGLVGLGIVFICRYRFKKNNPHYSKETTAKATVIEDKPNIVGALARLLNLIFANRRR